MALKDTSLTATTLGTFCHLNETFVAGYKTFRSVCISASKIARKICGSHITPYISSQISVGSKLPHHIAM